MFVVNDFYFVINSLNKNFVTIYNAKYFGIAATA